MFFRATYLPWLMMASAAIFCAGCSRAGGTTQANSDSIAETKTQEDLEVGIRVGGEIVRRSPQAERIDRLRTAADFDSFARAAIAAPEEFPDDADLEILRCEALLASGRDSEAEDSAIRAATLARQHVQPDLAALAIKLWTTARLRQAKSLEDVRVDAFLEDSSPVPAESDECYQEQSLEESSAAFLQFWKNALAGRQPYRINRQANTPVELRTSRAAAGTLPFDLVTVEVLANETRMPVVFIDTGAQYTLITVDAARTAGVRMGNADTQLTGFAGLNAQPGLIDTLDLGGLVLHDVPVLVGDSTPLVAARGQMSLGIDLLHHVRMSIDYPNRRVTAEAAQQPRREVPNAASWSIPIWSFSQISLTRGELPDGTPARVLIDTGDRVGAFVSYRWARSNLPQLEGPSTSMVFRYKKRNLTLPGLALGDRMLGEWPVIDTMPRELDRLNLVDIMLGHDLLANYRITIDLPGRVLHLEPLQQQTVESLGERYVVP